MHQTDLTMFNLHLTQENSLQFLLKQLFFIPLFSDLNAKFWKIVI